MSKTAKWLIAIIVVIIVIAGVWYFNSPSSSSVSTETGPIIIGFIGPLSGDGASYGLTEKNTTQMAVDEINNAGGINGRKVTVVYEDSKGDGKEATIATTKLIDVDKVQVILGGTFSSETLAAAPIAEKSKVILFSAFSSNPQITNSGDYVFRNSPSDVDVAKLDANAIVNKSYKKVALISENTDYPQGVRKIMKEVFASKGVEVVADELYGGAGTSVSDFRDSLTKIKAAKPDVIYINPAGSKSGGLIVKQARQLGIVVPLNGNFSLSGPDSLAAAGKFIEGVTVSDTSGLAEKGNLILAKYKQLFGSDPANLFELGAAYDRVYIIRDAIAAVGYDPDKIQAYIYGLSNYSGALGNYKFDSNGDVVGVGFTNYVIKNGKEAPLQ